MHILIIEDEQGIRQELSQLLKNALYEVTAVEQIGVKDFIETKRGIGYRI
nr:hypothetical protein [uncultured Blautia sp.]